MITTAGAVDAFDNEMDTDDDGTVTFTMTPSSWHAFGIAPDTYHMFNGDSYLELEYEYLSEELGTMVTYEDLEIDFDMDAVVRDLSEVLTDWIAEELRSAGLESASCKLVDTWSPAYYNFVTDGFEVEVTCDAAELRSLTSDFDVDTWAREHYSSYDGFHSYVTGRMLNAEWHAHYDAEFRVESLLSEHCDSEGWVLTVAEEETEAYMSHATFTWNNFLDTEYSIKEWTEYADELTADMRNGYGTMPLPI